jgi:alpha-aminoadipate carrier protein LysW
MILLTKNKKAECFDCETVLDIPQDAVIGEIVTCQSCGLEFEVKKVENNLIALEELVVEGEDWGE